MKYDQLVVAQGVVYNDKSKKELLDLFKKHNFHKPKIVGAIITLPDKDCNGKDVPNTGGRSDLFFFINNKDIDKFSIWRFNYGFRWWEDIFYNKQQNIYPESFIKQYPPRW